MKFYCSLRFDCNGEIPRFWNWAKLRKLKLENGSYRYEIDNVGINHLPGEGHIFNYSGRDKTINGTITAIHHEVSHDEHRIVIHLDCVTVY